MDETSDKLLTTEEVAQYLKIPAATVRWLRHQGTGPKGFKVGRSVRYTESAVREYVEAQQAKEQRV